ncbi:MAG: protein-glutamate O-methyltransferase CheR [Deltaproteobacteria bacterium]|nr:protein-glutamate O-methyltransferase CheR [Deltaproteobacteria bacterium]
MIKVSPQEYQIFCRYVYDICGINLASNQSYLIETRLAPLLKKLSCNSYTELYNKSRGDRLKKIEQEIIDAITTNETYFFRDKSPFDLLQFKIIPDLIDKRSVRSGPPPSLRIWSAACSFGQEVYSLAITLRELLGNDLGKYRISIVGTDISDEAISRSSYGLYNQFEVERGLSPEKLRLYFNPVDKGWRIRDELRSLVSFRKLNLLQPFTTLGKFDIILCRNVAIYFPLPDKVKLYEKIAASLVPDGYLLIGAQESLTGITNRFESKRYLRSIFYQLKN